MLVDLGERGGRLGPTAREVDQNDNLPLGVGLRNLSLVQRHHLLVAFPSAAPKRRDEHCAISAGSCLERDALHLLRLPVTHVDHATDRRHPSALRLWQAVRQMSVVLNADAVVGRVVNLGGPAHRLGQLRLDVSPPSLQLPPHFARHLRVAGHVLRDGVLLHGSMDGFPLSRDAPPLRIGDAHLHP